MASKGGNPSYDEVDHNFQTGDLLEQCEGSVHSESEGSVDARKSSQKNEMECAKKTILDVCDKSNDAENFKDFQKLQNENSLNSSQTEKTILDHAEVQQACGDSQDKLNSCQILDNCGSSFENQECSTSNDTHGALTCTSSLKSMDNSGPHTILESEESITRNVTYEDASTMAQTDVNNSYQVVSKCVNEIVSNCVIDVLDIEENCTESSKLCGIFSTDDKVPVAVHVTCTAKSDVMPNIILNSGSDTDLKSCDQGAENKSCDPGTEHRSHDHGTEQQSCDEGNGKKSCDQGTEEQSCDEGNGQKSCDHGTEPTTYDQNIISNISNCVISENKTNLTQTDKSKNVYDIDASDPLETFQIDSSSLRQAKKRRKLDENGTDSTRISLNSCNNMSLSNNVSGKSLVEQADRQKVVYIYSKELIETCDQMQKIPNRASMVHRLIEAYGLTRYMSIVEPRKATDEEVLTFHDSDYINFLKKISSNDDIEKFEDEAMHYGLSYDCPIHHGLYKYATLTSGATIVAAECLLQQRCRVAISWCGGWHHAAKDHASGFCYINDIVLGILKLRQKYDRILYVDLDLHHGDGVEDAFLATSKVMTVSFHKFLAGFFPGTGSVEDIGIGKGQYYTVNVPLLDGIRDTEFTPFVCRVLDKIKQTYRPEVVVCHCGADGLAGDPMESFNLTHKGLGKCGYNLSNTARCWSYLTGIAVGKQLPTEIPDHQFFMDYGPDYDLEVHAGNRKNDNTAPYMRKIYGIVMGNLSRIPVQM